MHSTAQYLHVQGPVDAKPENDFFGGQCAYTGVHLACNAKPQAGAGTTPGTSDACQPLDAG